MNTATATESVTAAAAYQIKVFAGRDYSTTSLREYHINLLGQTIATASGFKTKAAAGKAADKLACKIIAAMFAETAEAREIVQRAAELNNLWNAKKFRAWKIREAQLRALVAATFCAA